MSDAGGRGSRAEGVWGLRSSDVADGDAVRNMCIKLNVTNNTTKP